MQSLSRLPSNNLHFLQAKRPSFNCRTSALNPSTISFKPASAAVSATASAAAPSELTRTHLANLEKLLQKQAPEPVQNSSNRGSQENRGGTLLERLNLARIWPERKAAEEMSPRHLNRLQRLLSMTQEYSPRNNIASRWLEYHGSNDWAGLLDPLDENLRREVVRYGEFIQAAYHAFHSDPATSAGEDSSPRHVALPDRSYKVTKGLYATSSLGFPKWVDEMAPDLGWMTQRSSWVGYVAVCDDKREIQRLGRRDIVIALRGTSTCLEWIENVRAQMVPIAGEDPAHGDPKVECGFQSLYKTRGEQVASLAESVVEEVRRLIEMYEGETLSITVTGHSLGAALALLVANDLTTCAKEVPPIAVISFGGPKVGNKDFADQIVAKNVKVLRIVNDQDLITKVPGIFLDIELDERLKNSKIASVLHSMPSGYSHVGTELRVSTEMSPFLKPDADVACCHDLEAYLHLVDGFLSSSCPSRPNAKRSLVRLLNDQRSNVKKLYTSKVKSLSLSVEKEGTFLPACLPSPS